MPNEIGPEENPHIAPSPLEGRGEIKASELLTTFVNGPLSREYAPYFHCFAKDTSEIRLTKESFARYLENRHKNLINSDIKEERGQEEQAEEFIQKYIENLSPEEVERLSAKGLGKRINNDIDSVEQKPEEFISKKNFSYKWEKLTGDTRIRIGFIPRAYTERDVVGRLSVIDKSLSAINRIHGTFRRLGGETLGSLEEIIKEFITCMEQDESFTFDVLFRDEIDIEQEEQ